MNQNIRHVTFLAASCLFAAGGIQAAPGNAQTPETQPPVAANPPLASPPQHQHRRGPRQLVLSIADDAQAELWKPDLTRQAIDIQQGKVTFKGTGVDNYHAIVAQRTDGKLTESAIRYHYARGKPSGHSSTELTAANKSTLEIVPDPIPREHFHYHSDQTWDFIIRFQGLPVADRQVTLKTTNGSQVEATTAADGRVSLHIPDDFPDMVAGERDKRSAEFTVSTRYTEADQMYQSTLNAAYKVNPHHWRSLNLGIVVLGIGMLTGGFIGRVGRGKKNKGKQS
jgi:hypothetical protein